ncbi:hypothetical protein [Paenibacillus sp. J23TS9]|uniref:hypothetical protein n=1 Tax=Paenibacillus sp. J23TS9 TaxID=2807193 RepID=UPI001BCFAA6C|nr:hypothetical protein [Paenibacillus sp. J23TS9]
MNSFPLISVGFDLYLTCRHQKIPDGFGDYGICEPGQWTLGILGAVGLILTLCSVLKQSKPKQQAAADLAQPNGV